MNLNRKTVSYGTILIIVACLGASLMMIAPVEDVDAWPYHTCCDWDHDWFVNGNIIEIYWDCDHYFHAHAWSCGFVCP